MSLMYKCTQEAFVYVVCSRYIPNNTDSLILLATVIQLAVVLIICYSFDFLDNLCYCYYNSRLIQTLSASPPSWWITQR